jgi:hypothetical protein
MPKLQRQEGLCPSELFRRLWPARSNFTPALQSVALRVLASSISFRDLFSLDFDIQPLHC